ncbi:MAG TPA: hypothetical protein DDY98_07190 [Ruminococcaceae bacterium]|nr:hypothetical protein [Oscillospiraceae bacterium]
MKKIIAFLLAAAAVFSLTACTVKNDKADDNTASTVTALYTLPGKKSALFGDVPQPDWELTFYNRGQDDWGFVYQWEFKGTDYKQFKSYIDDLKKADFAYYSTSNYRVAPEKEPEFADKAKDCGYNATWVGVRKGLYVTVMWYGDEFFEKHNITGPNCRVMFYTYNPFRLPETTTAKK